LPVAAHMDQIQYTCEIPGRSVVATIATKPDAAATAVLATVDRPVGFGVLRPLPESAASRVFPFAAVLCPAAEAIA